MPPEIVTRAQWIDMVERSRSLLVQATAAERNGYIDQARALWRELGPLNRKIRSQALLRVRGIDA